MEVKRSDRAREKDEEEKEGVTIIYETAKFQSFQLLLNIKLVWNKNGFLSIQKTAADNHYKFMSSSSEVFLKNVVL